MKCLRDSWHVGSRGALRKEWQAGEEAQDAPVGTARCSRLWMRGSVDFAF